MDTTDSTGPAGLTSRSQESRWLLLIHQIPPKPAYLRVKIGRRLRRLGAVAIKNTVYALPKNEEAHEHFQWVLREIREGDGDATICEARFVDGLLDEDIEKLFNDVRNAEYRELAEEARALTSKVPRKLGDDLRTEIQAELGRLAKRLAEVKETDFFGAPGRAATEGAIAALEERLKTPSAAAVKGPLVRREDYRGCIWVTRKGIHIDRMASAWLIRRFVDPGAKFLFVPGKGYQPKKGELRFDMFEGEFTHEGDRCTFETLIERMNLKDPALRGIAEIVHDIDLKDGKFRRDEAAGIDRLVAGTCMAHKEDEERLRRASAVFEDLYEYFQRKGGK
ncbi:MAG: chromate resistance protein [Planctomycetes bacterium]|nr:chromate resistance protein [Planctomycetota bacterium]